MPETEGEDWLAGEIGVVLLEEVLIISRPFLIPKTGSMSTNLGRGLHLESSDLTVSLDPKSRGFELTLNPRFSNREMISPTSPRATPSGLGVSGI